MTEALTWGEHQRATTRPSAMAIGGVAQVATYCSRCRVAWPCPQVTWGSPDAAVAATHAVDTSPKGDQ